MLDSVSKHANMIGYTVTKLTPSKSRVCWFVFRLLLCLRSGSISYYFPLSVCSILILLSSSLYTCQNIFTVYTTNSVLLSCVQATFVIELILVIGIGCYGRNAEDYSLVSKSTEYQLLDFIYFGKFFNDMLFNKLYRQYSL